MGKYEFTNNNRNKGININILQNILKLYNKKTVIKYKIIHT